MDNYNYTSYSPMICNYANPNLRELSSKMMQGEKLIDESLEIIDTAADELVDLVDAIWTKKYTEFNDDINLFRDDILHLRSRLIFSSETNFFSDQEKNQTKEKIVDYLESIAEYLDEVILRHFIEGMNIDGDESIPDDSEHLSLDFLRN